MRLKIVGMTAALISLSTQLVDLGSSLYLEELGSGREVVGWLPQLDTVGRTTVAYSYASQAAVFGLSILGVAALGYWAGSRIDLAAQYRPLLGYLAVGGGAGHLLAIPVWGLIIGVQFWYGAALYLGLLLGAAVATGLQFALVGLAGAALADLGVAPILRPDGDTGANPSTGLDPE